jgi:redox-sensitive bicupin YhaK (pirin superfamily)
MSQKIPRRGLLTRLSVGVSSLLAAPLVGKAASLTETKAMDQRQDTILKVKPLGFQWETADPFLFCVHHDDKFPRGNDQFGPDASLEGRHIGQDFIIKDGWRMYHGETVPGFPYHPHRGFETITVARKGMVDHADSMGAAGRYGDGDVQWMTAAKGVQHSEMFPLLKKDAANPMELFQIWLNLPRKSKMVEPHFAMMWRETIPHHHHTDANGKKTEVEVLVGKLLDKSAPTPPPNSWANDPNNHVAIWNIRLEPGATWTIPKSVTGINRTLYVYQGNELKVADRAIATYHSVEVLPDRDLVLANGKGEARILVLQGRPIGEPVVQHGPFVMSTREEIQQAFNDYQRTQFGGWPWKRRDPVHDRTLGRFARHADGREEFKG